LRRRRDRDLPAVPVGAQRGRPRFTRGVSGPVAVLLA